MVQKNINKKQIILIIIAAYLVAGYAWAGGMCEFIKFFGGTLMALGGADIILSWIGIDLAQKVGFRKLSFFIPYIIIFIGGYIFSQGQSCGF